MEWTGLREKVGHGASDGRVYGFLSAAQQKVHLVTPITMSYTRDDGSEEVRGAHPDEQHPGDERVLRRDDPRRRETQSEKEETTMSKVTMTKCDHCGKKVENPYEERGWLQLSADLNNRSISIARSVGRYNTKTGSFETDFVQSVTDFCGVACLVAALDKKAREREDKLAEEIKKQTLSVNLDDAKC